MRNMKRALALLVALCMCISVMSIGVFAENETIDEINIVEEKPSDEGGSSGEGEKQAASETAAPNGASEEGEKLTSNASETAASNNASKEGEGGDDADNGKLDMKSGLNVQAASNTALQLGSGFEEIDGPTTSAVESAELVASEVALPAADTSAVSENVAKIGDTEYATLAEAVDAAADNAIITLLKDTTLATRLDIDKSITLDGGNNTIKADPSGTWPNNNDDKHLINVSAENVTIKNVTLDGDSKKGNFGLQYYTASGSIEDVTIKGFAGCGLLINASDVTATGNLTLENCGYDNKINVGYGSGISPAHDVSFNASAATLTGVASIYYDDSDETNAGEKTITITAPNSGCRMY